MAGYAAIAHQTDITQNDQIEALVKATADAFGGRIDILVNNAARSFFRPLMDMREDGFDKIFNTNVKGPFLLSRAVAKVMMGHGGGKIITSTIGAERGGPMMGGVHASKAAVKMLTMCMATEWAPFKILVNAVGPGLTRTHFSAPIWSNPEMERQLTARIPMARLGEAEDVVGAVLFLCSEASAYITGQSIYVDGGNLAT